MKLAFLDVETTGLDPIKHTIWCIGGILEVDGQEVDRFRLECRPREGKAADEEALRVGNIDLAQLLGMPNPNEVKKALEQHLIRDVDRYDKQDKWFFIAYNASFDYQFLRRWWEESGDVYFGSLFWNPPLDVMGLAGWHLMNHRRLLPNFKLSTVCEYLGVTLEKAHDALRDIEATQLLWERLQEYR